MSDCSYCGKEFTPRRKDQRYCSKSCRNMASRRRTKRRSKTSKNANNLPGLTKICVNEKAHTSIPAKRKLAFCPTCGKEFYARREGQRYCSRSCAGKAKIAKAQKARRESLADTSCRHYDNGACAWGIKSCDGCAYNFRTVEEVMKVEGGSLFPGK